LRARGTPARSRSSRPRRCPRDAVVVRPTWRAPTLPCAPVAVSTTARRSVPALRVPTAVQAVLVSRLVVWAAAVPAMLALGYSGWRRSADPTNFTAGLGDVGEVIGAPVMRWDSVYYLQIAQDGYTQRKQAGFFPLYPLLMDVVDTVTASTVVAGVLIS